MKKIGISQRTSFIESRNETRDELDQALIDLLSIKGFAPIPIPNSLENTDAYLSQLNIDGFVLSGGNDSAERSLTESSILDFAIRNSLPVLGICHGLQFINKYFGGYISSINNHVGKNHSIKFTNSGEKYIVNSYHDLGINEASLSEELKILATHEKDGTVEAATHIKHDISGIMWHPERSGCSDELNDIIFKEIFNV